MLIQPDRNELGDKRLDPTESVAAKREECIAMASKKKIPHQADLEDKSRGLGPRMQFTEFVSRLRKVVTGLKVLDGSPGNLALYVRRDDGEFEEAFESWDNGRDVFFLFHKYVGGFPKADLPEYSTLDVDNAGLATKENRGWRSVLMNLITANVVSYKKVVAEFGDTGLDQRGWRWREQLQLFKN